MHPWRSKSCRRARSTVWCRVFGLNNLVAITTSAVLAVTPTALPQQQVSAPAADADRTQIAALPGRTGQARFVNDSSLRPPGTDRSTGGGVPSGLPGRDHAASDRVWVTLANWAGDRCSRFGAGRLLTPYSGSPDRLRRPYLARTTRRRTSPVALTASCTTWNRSTGLPAVSPCR